MQSYPMRFQSTLPARGATAAMSAMLKPAKTFQSTLPARGATIAGNGKGQKHIISIHAPRTGSDMLPIDRVKPYARFQSTLPARGATSDGQGGCTALSDFNPRSPHGERP